MKYYPLLLATMAIELILWSSACAADEAGRSVPASSSNRVRSSGDLVCGPRCVQYLLRYFGKGDDELKDLVREIQWPNIEAGSSLSALEAALNKRGVFTRSLLISPQSRLCWRYPVLVHLPGDGDQALGHFVVWLPSSDILHDRIWSGLDGVRSPSPARHAAVRSGAVILTSPTPIADPGVAVYDSHIWIRRATQLMAAAMGAGLIWLVSKNVFLRSTSFLQRRLGAFSTVK
jgi:hypothetical protein